MPSQRSSRVTVDRAALFITRLFEAADHIAEHPDAGRAIPELSDVNRREILVGSYRLMHRTEGADVWIVAVVHGARDWPNPPR